MPAAEVITPTEVSKDPNHKGSLHPNETRRFFIIGFAGLIGVIVALLVGGVMYRVYAQTAGDPATLTVAKILRLPAVKVNGTQILYSDYSDDLKAIHHMEAYRKSSSQTPSMNGGANNDILSPPALTETQMSDQVLLRLVNNVLLQNLAARYNVTIEDKDLEQLKNQILQQFKATTEVDNELQKRYGWNLSIYEQKVIRPFILQSKLAERVQADPEKRAAVRQQAKEVLDKIKGGADFAELAKQHGQDGTAAQGGDLGWFKKGDMVPQFESAAFVLKKGELAPELIETPYGYHIIRLDDRKIEKAKDNKGKLVSGEQVRARHILFRFPTLDQYLDTELKQAQLHLYLKVHNPFQTLKT